MSSSSKPDWVRAKAPLGPTYARLKELTKQYSLHTVCEEAHCPNVGECWGSGTATFMIMGELCTRACRFCNVKNGKPNGILDREEPANVARAVKDLGLKYVVLTSVDRDDLSDGGASHFAQTITAIRSSAPDAHIEALIPDFQGSAKEIKTVVHARPDVIGHNLETTEALTPKVRDPRAKYHRSLKVLEHVKRLDLRIFTKSSLMLGLGEQEDDVLQTMRDLRSVDTDFLTLGQYLRPSPRNLPVVEYVAPKRFDYYRAKAEQMGFRYVASGPLVRSSYRAGELFLSNIIGRTRRQTSRNEEKSLMDLNFSWVIEDEVAGSRGPRSKSDLISLKKQGIGALVRLVEADEAYITADDVRETGLEDYNEPVPDFHAPTDAQIDKIIEYIDTHVQAGVPVDVSCYAGIGRSGVVLACYLVHRGYSAKDALELVRRRRGRGPEVSVQIEAVEAYWRRINSVPNH